MAKSTRPWILLAVVLLILPAAIQAGQALIPHEFHAGEPARATQMNENLQALAGAIDDNDLRIARLEAAIRESGGKTQLNLGTGGTLMIDDVVLDGQGLKTLVSMVTRDGSSPPAAATNCKDLRDRHPQLRSGVYWIDPNGGSTWDAFQAYCDMEFDGGGWTFVMFVGDSRIDRDHLDRRDVVERGDGGYSPPDRGARGHTYVKTGVWGGEVMIALSGPEPRDALTQGKLVMVRGNGWIPCWGSFEYRTDPNAGWTAGYQTCPANRLARWLVKQNEVLLTFGSGAQEYYLAWAPSLGGDGSTVVRSWWYTR